MGIILLLLLMMVVKLDAFFSLIITALFVGLLSGIPLLEIIHVICNGVGQTMGNIILILCFGAMLGKLIEHSGAAHAIVYKLTALFGLKKIQYAILITGFLVGLPMMYNASFLVLIPIIYTFASTTGLPLLYLGIPLAATLSIAHGYLPPHPAPTYVSFIYGADLNKTLLVGLVPVIPACLFAGIYLSKFFKHIKVSPPKNLFENKHIPEEKRPGLAISIFTAITPVILMLFGALIDIFIQTPPKGVQLDYMAISASFISIPLFNSVAGYLLTTLKFFSEPNMALLAAVLLGIYTLGIRRGETMGEIMKLLGKSVSAIGMIILIIGAGGAFSFILREGGVNEYIGQITANIQVNPLLLAFCTAAILRLAVGSATVATMTAAPIMLPIALSSGVSPELMVLATGSGSLLFSHFNDVGFWMFKEYFNVSIKQTFAIWTVMESIVGLVGLGACLLMDQFMGRIPAENIITALF
ncbi:idonate transporter [Persicobacter diffluens]|uniref:Idonate transporter n=2 Tax=Persicobacter diffluens TaxID=981 RepID=A0AAN4W4D6_9BACT|nr:idonate transporter [Persicobacter diffluens]